MSVVDDQDLILNQLQSIQSLSSGIGFSKKQQADNKIIVSLVIELDAYTFDIHQLQMEINLRKDQIIYRKKMLVFLENVSPSGYKIIQKKITSDEKRLVSLEKKIKTVQKQYLKTRSRLFQFV